jgi:hypothetical protein
MQEVADIELKILENQRLLKIYQEMNLDKLVAYTEDKIRQLSEEYCRIYGIPYIQEQNDS